MLETAFGNRQEERGGFPSGCDMRQSLMLTRHDFLFSFFFGQRGTSEWSRVVVVFFTKVMKSVLMSPQLLKFLSKCFRMMSDSLRRMEPRSSNPTGDDKKKQVGIFSTSCWMRRLVSFLSQFCK